MNAKTPHPAPAAERTPLRADARRNRDSILRTAARHFARDGVNASLDEIARAAGVGPGTLYRHFPSREALLAATLRERQSELLARADAARALPCGDQALAAWLSALQDYLCTYDGLPAPLLAAIQASESVLALSCETLLELTGRFLEQAQRQGRVRRHISARDLFLGALGIAWAMNREGVDPAQRNALQALLANGYRQPDNAAAGNEAAPPDA